MGRTFAHGAAGKSCSMGSPSEPGHSDPSSQTPAATESEARRRAHHRCDPSPRSSVAAEPVPASDRMAQSGSPLPSATAAKQAACAPTRDPLRRALRPQSTEHEPLSTFSSAPPGNRAMCVHATEPEYRDRAAALAEKLDARVAIEASDVRASDIVLRFDRSGLALAADGMELRPDFADLLPRLSPARLNSELLVKAAKTGTAYPRAVDATAGLGSDALLLAAAGFDVDLYESNPAIFALLANALERARESDELAPIVARMTLHGADSIPALRNLGYRPDVILLDPMFPKRSKSAAVKKKFQLLHLLELPCADAENLLEAALAAHPRKVVIKRPPKGPHLAGVKPSYSLAGKAIRYDCIALA